MADLKLFNCCHKAEEPDWSDFDALEVGGCIVEEEEGSDETFTIGGIARDEAQFFTVYGHLKVGGVEAITDCDTFDEVIEVANILAERTGFPVHVCC